MAGSARLSALSRHLLGANPTDGYSADMSEGTTRGAHLVAAQLVESGIDTIFTVLGGPMIEVLSACVDAGIKVVNCRHEMNACFAATSWGFINQKCVPSVCWLCFRYS